jgi:predicted lipoprotein
MRSRPRPWLLLTASLAAGGGDGGSGSPDARSDGFDRRALLRNLAEHVIAPTLDELDARADALVVAVDAWCAAGDRAAAQDAWRAAMSTWQRAEVMQVGPAAMDGGAPRDRIYSWPVVSSCAVDQEVMARWLDPAGYDLSTELTNRRGLAALEYLLFTTTLAVTCAPTAAPPGWNDLSDADKQTARCRYAQAAALDLAAQSEALRTAWSPSGGNYVEALATATGFASAHEAVNVVSDAMFYLDSATKDLKLGAPAGITMSTCPVLGDPCPQDLESKFGAHGRENVAANLRGFQALFTGGDGAGFDDFLTTLGAPELAAQMETDLADAIARVEAIPGSLETAITGDRQAVADAHAAVKRVTDAMKSRFLTVLSLDIPDDVAADND